MCSCLRAFYLRGLVAEHGPGALGQLPPAARIDPAFTLGTVLLKCGRFEDAEPLLVTAYDGLKERADCPPAIKRDVLMHLGKLYESWDSVEPGEGYADRATGYRHLLDRLGLAAGTGP